MGGCRYFAYAGEPSEEERAELQGWLVDLGKAASSAMRLISLAEKAEQRLNNNDEKDMMAMGLNKLKQAGLDSEEVSQTSQRQPNKT